jgi:glycerophosphoryl diester phosphodiesterase
MKKTFYSVLVLSLIYFIALLSPGVDPVDDIPYYKDQSFTVIAHRGGRGLVPGNTIEAAVNAVNIGSDVIEIDIHLTADNVLVVRHDDLVDTTSDGTGLIADLTFEQIGFFNAGFHEVDFPGATFDRPLKIPSLASLFERLPDQRFLIELKPTNTTAADTLCTLVEEHKLEHQVLVGSFHTSVLKHFRKHCPNVPTSLGKNELLLLSLLQRLHLGHFFSSSGYAMQVPQSFNGMDIITPDLIALAQRLNLRVEAWTINDIESMVNLKAMGVDGIITDYPDQLIDNL